MPRFHRSLLLPLLVTAAPLAAQTSDHDHLRQNVFAQQSWRELGPVIFGGRIVDLAVHPQDHDVWWVASGSGGLFKTTNHGITFEPLFQDAQTISIGDVAVAPSAPDVLYVGTGEANNQRSSYWGNGVYKSTDGGKTFAHVGLEGTEHIGRIAVHPTNPDVVFVAALGALYTPSEERGLYLSTNGGGSWKRVKDLGPDVGFVDVAIDPQDPQVVYAASYERRRRAWNLTEGGPGSRLWRSTDGGSTWTMLEGGLPQGSLGRIGIDVFARDGRTLYATIENLNPATPAPAEPRTENAGQRAAGEGDKDASAAGEAVPDAETLADPLAAAEFFAGEEADEAQDPVRAPRTRQVGGEVWRSDDRGATWQKTSTRSIGGSPGYYYGQIRVDPNDADTVYVLSVPVYKSTDGGKTWTPRSGRGGPRGARTTAFHANLHVDHHALWIDPDDSAHCILGNDGGLAVTFDGGATWDHLHRLPIAQFYTVAADLRSPYRVYGGLQDNGTWGFPIRSDTSAGLAAVDAYRIDGGDGFYVACDPFDPDVVYSESQFGGMSRQNLRTGERKGIKPKADKGSPPLRFNWMTPIVLSPHAPHTVYTGSQYLHRSRDRGDTWTTISGDLTTNDADKLEGNVPHCTITTIAESPRREGMLWVGTDDGRVWLGKDGGQRWTELSDRFPAAVRGLWVSRVEASPHDADCAFVAFTGYREDRREPLLFRTDDGGETFRSIANDLPQEPINVVRQHPLHGNVLLVGTEMGAYASIDDGASWHRLGNNLPRVAVHDLMVHPRERHVLAATHGRGIWALDARGFDTLDEQALAKELHVLPPSDGVLLRRAFSRGHTGARDWSAPNPFMTPVFRFHLREDHDDAVKVEVVDAAGTVLFEREVEAKAGYHEVAWQPARGGFGGRGRGGPSGPRPGQFAVRVTHGEQSAILPFEVIDARGPGGGPFFGDDEELDEPWNEEEAEEREAEAAPAEHAEAAAEAAARHGR